MAPKWSCTPVFGAVVTRIPSGGPSFGAANVSLVAGARPREGGSGDLCKICNPAITITNPDTAIRRHPREPNEACGLRGACLGGSFAALRNALRYQTTASLPKSTEMNIQRTVRLSRWGFATKCETAAPMAAKQAKRNAM